MTNSFNLVNEKWIPTQGSGLVSLRDIVNNDISGLSGDPVEKRSVLNLCLCIAQSSWPIKNNEERIAGGTKKLKEALNEFLTKYEEKFDLYGESRIFQNKTLFKIADERNQMAQSLTDANDGLKEEKKANKGNKDKIKEIDQLIKLNTDKINEVSVEKKKIGCLLPHIAQGNTSIVSDRQRDRTFSNAEIAMILLRSSSNGLSGKKCDNSIACTDGYLGKVKDDGKVKSAPAGPGTGHMGYLHSYILGKNIIETIYINLLAEDEIDSIGHIDGLGKSPLIFDVLGEDCEMAKDMKTSYMGRLLPYSRFIYVLEDQNIYLTEGIYHGTHKTGNTDLSTSIKVDKDIKALWVDPQRKPWRYLSSLLAFLSHDKGSFICWQLYYGLKHTKDLESFTLWSGGLQLSSNAGEQYVSGKNSYVDSVMKLYTKGMGDFNLHFNECMSDIDHLSKVCYMSVKSYYTTFNSTGEGIAGKASQLFWEKAEDLSQDLIDACFNPENGDKDRIMKKYILLVSFVYDESCPIQTERQVDSWAKNRPNTYNIYKKYSDEKEIA